ncbi:hypothetical protein RTP6_001173 [Batrachochytrium dendrobatidis]
MAFVIVKYGEKMVNPNCLGAVMLSHIKKSCGYADISENIDLASETGEVVDLVSRPREYARKFLEPRGSYILVKVIGDEMEDSSPTYISLLDQAGEKIKFSVTNPTFRTRIKGKTGTRGDPPKSDKTDDVLTALPVKIGKVTQQAKSGKTEKAESRGTDKLGSISAGGLSGAEDLSIHRKSIVEPILSSAVSLEKKSTAKSTTKASTSAVPAGLTPIITAASELNQTTIKKGK